LAKYFVGTTTASPPESCPSSLSVATLDVGVTTDMLYLRSSEKPRVIDCSAAPGCSRLASEAHIAQSLRTPLPPKVRYGDPLAVFDNSKLLRIQRRLQQDAHLEKWHGLPKQEMTPAMVWEWKALQLKGYAHPKRFFKASDSSTFPTHFHVGRVIGGTSSSLAVGGGRECEAAGTISKRFKKGKGMLDTLLEDKTVQNWTKKRFEEITESKSDGRNGRHVKKRKNRKRR